MFIGPPSSTEQPVHPNAALFPTQPNPGQRCTKTFGSSSHPLFGTLSLNINSRHNPNLNSSSYPDRGPLPHSPICIRTFPGNSSRNTSRLYERL